MDRPRNTSINSAQRQQQWSRRRSLEDVLHDPNADWGEIRESLKSSGGCTNVAIIGAIANNGTGARIARGVSTSRDVMENTFNEAENNTPEAQDDTSLREDYEAKVAVEETETPASPVDAASAAPAPKPREGADPTNSQARRPARVRGGMRLGPSHKSFKQSASPRDEPQGQMNEQERDHTHSVNIMDFGVDNQISTHLDCSFSSTGGSSGCSGASESGFIGWDHSRRKMAKEETGLPTQHSDSALISSLRSSCGQSNCSDFVDDEGFLDWKKRSITMNDLESEGLGLELEGFRDWQGKSVNHADPSPPTIPADEPNPVRTALESGMRSFNSSLTLLTGSLKTNRTSFNFTDPFAKSDRKKDWKIECYEDPRDNDTLAEFGRQQRGGGVSARRRSFKRSSSSRTDEPKGAATDKGEVNMNDIKEALIKVAKSSGKGSFSVPASRRHSLNDDSTIAEEEIQTNEQMHPVPRVSLVRDKTNADVDYLSDTESPPKDGSINISTAERSNAARSKSTSSSIVSSMQGLRQINAGPASTLERKKTPASRSAGIDPKHILSQMVTVADGAAEGNDIRVVSVGDFRQMNKAPKHSNICMRTPNSNQSKILTRNNHRTVQEPRPGQGPSKGILSRMSLLSSTEKEPERNIWNGGSKGSSHTPHHNDTREAILINKRDGHVDITKERRKLYSKEQEDQGALGLLRRPSRSSCATLSKGLSSCTTLSMGLERPRTRPKLRNSTS